MLGVTLRSERRTHKLGRCHFHQPCHLQSRVYAYTPIITAASSAVKPFDIESAGGPTRSCRTAQTAGAEAPRQRRAQRAKGKRLRGVTPVVASAAAAQKRAATISEMLRRNIPV